MVKMKMKYLINKIKYLYNIINEYYNKLMHVWWNYIYNKIINLEERNSIKDYIHINNDKVNKKISENYNQKYYTENIKYEIDSLLN